MVGSSPEVARKEPAPQRTVGHEGNPQFLAGSQHTLLRVARPDRVFALHGGDGHHLAGAWRGQSGAMRVLHGVLHVGNELVQLRGVEARDFLRPLEQQWVAHAENAADGQAYGLQ